MESSSAGKSVRESSLQKKITDVRILGQKRSMKISANNIAIEDAFTGVLSVVAVTIQNFAEGHIVTNVGSASVILKSDDLIRQRIRLINRQQASFPLLP